MDDVDLDALASDLGRVRFFLGWGRGLRPQRGGLLVKESFVSYSREGHTFSSNFFSEDMFYVVLHFSFTCFDLIKTPRVHHILCKSIPILIVFENAR